ncbi:HPr-like protein Crh [Eubacterium plexicaudatum ASF492]|uniref:HPr family phosphocarrier n=1 Tax=Eubacterium plexicaudatum ASF492 TaxID=1235802 RepID=N2A9S6_9FIRM|nr:HPr-like protein Crh [Eubacterium plexicaudatum ASF492]
MVSQKVKIKNPTGLHLRPAGVLCKNAIEYGSVITFRYGGNNIANAKSVLSVLGACIKSGDEIELICEGEDEEKALKEIVALIESGLGE